MSIISFCPFSSALVASLLLSYPLFLPSATASYSPSQRVGARAFHSHTGVTPCTQFSHFNQFFFLHFLIHSHFLFPVASSPTFIIFQLKVLPILCNYAHEEESLCPFFCLKPSYEIDMWSVEPWPKWMHRQWGISTQWGEGRGARNQVFFFLFSF